MRVLKSTAGESSWSQVTKGKFRIVLQTGSALAVVMMLGACSSVPDAINPVEWGKSVAGVFDGDDAATDDQAKQPIPGEDGEYPKLVDTPAKPIVTGDAERDALIAGLAADRENATYTKDGGRKDSEPVNSLQPEPQAADTTANDTPTVAASPAGTVKTSQLSDEETSETSSKSATSSGDWEKQADEIVKEAPTPKSVPETPDLDKAPAKVAEAAVATETQPQAVDNDQPQSVEQQYQRRLAEGAGAFGEQKNAASRQASPADSQQFDYGVYTDNEAVSVDESQLGGHSNNSAAGYDAQKHGQAGAGNMQEDNAMLAARLGVNSVDSVGYTGNDTQIAQIQFAYGSHRLGSRDDEVLEKVAAAWQQSGGILKVIGHASMHTADMSMAEHKSINRRISELRASSVVSKLIEMGVDPKHIFVGADGAADPRYYEGVPAGEAGNRRVEIFLDY